MPAEAIATSPAPGLSAAAGLVWLGLLHALWLGLAASSLLSVAFRARRRLSHRSRHAALAAALALVAAGAPALTALQSAAPARPSAPVTVAAFVGAAGPVRAGGVRSVPAVSVFDEPPAVERARRSARRALSSLDVALGRARPVAVAAWSATSAGLLGVLALGVPGVARLRRGSSPAPRAVRDRARRLARRLRLRRVPAVRIHFALDEPCLCGVVRPAVLLPGRWLETAGADAVDAVLAHELAHARRGDPVVNLAQRLVEALLFFHPGVRWLSRSLRRERELCADALAVRLTGDPLALARALESLARFRLGAPSSPASPRPAVAALGHDSPSLLPRIQELIGMTPTPPRPRLWPFAALPAAALVATLAASTVVARDEPPAAPKPPRPASPAPVPTRVRPEDDRQISFEVRFIATKPEGWRDRLGGRLAPLPPAEPGGESPGWMADGSMLRTLLVEAQRSETTNVVQAPKVTTFENATATILLSDKSFEVFAAPGRPAPAMYGEGTRVDLTGSWIERRAIRVAVDLWNTTRPPGKGLDFKITNATARADVPEGSSMVFIAGRSEAKNSPLELVAVVTPRRILVEAEEERLGANPAEGPATRRSPR